MLLNEMFLAERFFNAFEIKDKKKYANEIWDMLQKSYAPIGGIKGTGFNSKEDMIQNNHMFKIGSENGKPVAVIVYKNKGGRKLVAVGTNGSERGKEMVKMALKDEVLTGRSYAEVSGAAFGVIKKQIPPEILTSFLIPATKIESILGKKVIAGAGEDQPTVENDPYTPFYYQRELDGHMHTKIMFGDPQKAKFY